MKIPPTPVQGWVGNRLRLVPLEIDRHFENTYRWINDPTLNGYIMADDIPNTRPLQEKFFRNANGEKRIIFAIELLNGTHIGDSGFFKLDFPNGYGSTGTFIGHPHHGHGYGTEAAKLRAWYAFHVLGFRLLESGYIESNVGSRRMQEKSGYIEVARIPGLYWVRGHYRDSVRTILTRERWLELSGGKPVW